MNGRTKKLLTILAVMLAIAITGVGAFFMQQQTNSRHALAKPIKVACVGDSITQGFGYPQTLQRLLGNDFNVSNFGLGGTTVTLESPTPYMYEPVFDAAIAKQPDIVIIMLGTNDAHPGLQIYNGTFVNDYIALVNQFQNLTSKPEIWLVKPPPVFNDGTGLSTQYFREKIISGIEETAMQCDLPIIDVYSALLNHPEYFAYDGVHPDPRAANVIANEVYKAISR